MYYLKHSIQKYPKIVKMDKFQFAEMNILHRGNPFQTLNIVRRAIRMGYDAVVLNIDIGSSFTNALKEEMKVRDLAPPPKKKLKKQKCIEFGKSVLDMIPDPFLINESDLDLSTFKSTGRRFRQFSRLTVTLDVESIHRLQNDSKVKLYDIIAVRVPDEQILLTLQRKGDFIDLVTLDSNIEVGRISWLYKQKIVQSCIAAGIYFEICYSSALESSESRRQFLAHSRKLMEITSGNGVVISSGSSEMISLRAPYDVSNLCILFGISSKIGKKCISENPLAVLLRSQTRRTNKGAIYVVDLSNSNKTISSNSDQTLLLQNLANEVEEFRNEFKE